jgi:Uma2 family endonuclease
MATKVQWTWQNFLAEGKEGCKCELVEGEVISMTPVSLRHERLLARLMAYLVKYCETHPDWEWLPSNAVFTMTSENWRCPDASLVRVGRIPEARAEFAPDVAFEIHSPSDSAGEIQRKRKDYQDSRVVQVWIDPFRRLVEVVHPERPLQFFQEDGVLTMECVPDFALPLKNLFNI